MRGGASWGETGKLYPGPHLCVSSAIKHARLLALLWALAAALVSRAASLL